MYILLSSTEQTYRVDVRTQNVSADAAQVSVGFGAMTKPKLGERGAEQLEYALKSAAAAHAALSPLDWHYKVGAHLNLTPLQGDALVFEAGSNSAGLGYALALHVAFRRKLGKHLPATMPVVFATGKVESSGVVEKIGHLATKLQGAFNCAQSRHTGEPFVVYYPTANEADVSDEHHAQALQLGGRLVGVSRVGEALVDLLCDTYDGDLESRLEPFKGLASFDYADHFLFFGREEALSRLLTDYNNANGLLMVTGVSGAGKSSLIKAGLLPQLLKANLGLRYRITQPKQHESLNALLQYLLDNDYPQCAVNAKDLLTQDKEAETTFITYANAQPATLWYLDQFEEAANLFGEELESSQFTATLHRLASAIPNLSIVASVRSEYVSSIGFVPNESPVSQSIPPLGFEAIIENQAKAFGLHYEDGLVARLVEDATSIQHALPALEYMLQQMNEQRKQTPDSKALTHAQYDALGGLRGGITQQLETILQAHDRQSDEFFEHVLAINEDGKLYARPIFLDSLTSEIPVIAQLVAKLIDRQLMIAISTRHGTKVKLAHDCLFDSVRSWPRLKSWLGPRKRYLLWLEQNWSDFQKWKAASELVRENYLLTRDDLQAGLQLNRTYGTSSKFIINRPDVRAYIESSDEKEQKRNYSKFLFNKSLEELYFFSYTDFIPKLYLSGIKDISASLQELSVILDNISSSMSDFQKKSISNRVVDFLLNIRGSMYDACLNLDVERNKLNAQAIVTVCSGIKLHEIRTDERFLDIYFKALTHLAYFNLKLNDDLGVVQLLIDKAYRVFDSFERNDSYIKREIYISVVEGLFKVRLGFTDDAFEIFEYCNEIVVGYSDAERSSNEFYFISDGLQILQENLNL